MGGRHRRSSLAGVALTVALALAGCAHGHGDVPQAADEHGAPPHAGQSSGTSSATAAPADAPAPEPARPGEWFVTRPAAPGGYLPRPPAGAQDDYRCFLLDLDLDRDVFLTGLRLEAGVAAHHAIVYRVPPEQVARARAVDAADDGPGWRCFGGSGLPSGDADTVGSLDDAPWVGGWAPGNPERVTPDGFGVRLAAGSRVVLQMHYSALAGEGLDRTRLRVRLTDATRDLQNLQTMLLAAPVELPCAPGQQGPLCERDVAVLNLMSRFGVSSGARVAGLHLLCGRDPADPRPGPTQSCDRRINEAMTVRAAAAHMHLLGRSMRIEANPDTPRARTILNVPTYDFDDQGGTWLRRPVRLAPGDVVRVTCTHDATLRDALPALADEQDRYVVWGEGTTDEMCLGILSVTG